MAGLLKRQHNQPPQPSISILVYLEFWLSVTGQNYRKIALHHHPFILGLHITPQRIATHQLLEQGGFWSIKEAGWRIFKREDDSILSWCKQKENNALDLLTAERSLIVSSVDSAGGLPVAAGPSPFPPPDPSSRTPV
jgi:hypothetical protein